MEIQVENSNLTSENSLQQGDAEIKPFFCRPAHSSIPTLALSSDELPEYQLLSALNDELHHTIRDSLSTLESLYFRPCLAPIPGNPKFHSLN